MPRVARASQSEHPIGPESTKLPPIPAPAPTVPASLASSVPSVAPSSTRVTNDEGDEVTCVSTPRPFFDGPRTFLDDDDESTRQYDDLPTRVMHLDDGYAKDPPPSSGLRPSSVPRPVPRPSTSLMMAAPAPIDPPPPAAPMAYANVVVDQTVVSEPMMAPPVLEPTPPAPQVSADPLASDRALLRAIAAPTQLRVPIVAVRPAPPSPRMLAVVAAFTALGMLWVLAVSAMFLSFLAR